MVETTDQLKADIAQTRDNMAATIDEITGRLDRTAKRIPFYGVQRRQLYMAAGGIAAAVAVVLLAFYARKRL